jgi:hypothetical protein
MKKMGYYFIEGMPKETGALPGTQEPDKWGPYKIWVADRYECEGCGAQILAGFGSRPIDYHHTDTFKDNAKRLGADQFQVNDC